MEPDILAITIGIGYLKYTITHDRLFTAFAKQRIHITAFNTIKILKP